MSVYRVAVCEDEAGAGEQLAELCRDIFETWGVEAELSLFPTADGLDAAWEGFELYLLDIQMEGTDGLELARRLYERGVRDRVVFITGSAEYALAGYSGLSAQARGQGGAGAGAAPGLGAAPAAPRCSSAPAGGRRPCPRRRCAISKAATTP